jgi:hypothetical protein
MSTPFTNRFSCVITLTVALSITGCVPGLSHSYVSYNRNEKWAPTASLGADADRAQRVPCRGSVDVYRDDGVFYLLGPDGPWWQHRSYYGVYFKDGPDTPGAFYLMVSPDKNPVKTFGVRGTVVIEGRHVRIDVEYKDSNGRWKRPPINGRHKLNSIFPDDLPHPKASRRQNETDTAQPHHAADGSQPFRSGTIPEPLAAGSHR